MGEIHDGGRGRQGVAVGISAGRPDLSGRQGERGGAVMVRLGGSQEGLLGAHYCAAASPAGSSPASQVRMRSALGCSMASQVVRSEAILGSSPSTGHDLGSLPALISVNQTGIASPLPSRSFTDDDALPPGVGPSVMTTIPWLTSPTPGRGRPWWRGAGHLRRAGEEGRGDGAVQGGGGGRHEEHRDLGKLRGR